MIGSYEERTCDMLERLTTPTSALQLCIHKIATRYVAARTVLCKKLLMGLLDARVRENAGADDVAMNSMLHALHGLQCDTKNDGDSCEDGAPGQSRPAFPVFVIRDFDAFSDLEAERWLRWTHQVSTEGLAHVVLMTSATVMPSKAQWLQMRHKSGLSAASDSTHDFVAILLRPANGLIDSTSAEEKLCKAAVRDTDCIWLDNFKRVMLVRIVGNARSKVVL